MRDVKVMRLGRNGREGDGTLGMDNDNGVLSPPRSRTSLSDFPPLALEVHFEVFVQSSPPLLDLALPFPRAAQHSAPCTMAAANDEAPAPAEGAAAPAAPTAAPRAQTSAQTTLHKEFSENAAKLRAPFTEQGTFQLVVGARARARSLSFTIRRGSYTNTRAQSEGQADGHQGRKKYIARTHTLSICLSLCVVCVCVCFSSSSQDMVTARVLSVARV